MAFKLAWALCQRASRSKRVGDAMRSFLLQAVGLAALGTVADVVPLIDENRILVHHGLQSLRHRPTPGLAALMKLTKLDQKPCLCCEDIGFTIGPRLNAAGRLGQAQLGVELLTTSVPERAEHWPNICTSSTAAAIVWNAAFICRRTNLCKNSLIRKIMQPWSWASAAGIRASSELSPAAWRKSIIGLLFSSPRMNWARSWESAQCVECPALKSTRLSLHARICLPATAAMPRRAD